jgi:hypothetical protein
VTSAAATTTTIITTIGGNYYGNNDGIKPNEKSVSVIKRLGFLQQGLSMTQNGDIKLWNFVQICLFQQTSRLM